MTRGAQRTRHIAPREKGTIAQSIVEHIAEQMLDGSLTPGDRLPTERQLMASFGVSRSSVREALQGLMFMGLVERRSRQGTFVANTVVRDMAARGGTGLADRLQRERFLALNETRRTIEPVVARLAAQRASPDELAQLAHALAAYVAEQRQPASAEGDLAAHNRIHMIIAAMTGNPFFVSLTAQLLAAVPLSLRRRLAFGMSEDEEKSVVDEEIAMHSRLVEAIRCRQGEDAARAMDNHLEFERTLIMRLYPEPGEAAARPAPPPVGAPRSRNGNT